MKENEQIPSSDVISDQAGDTQDFPGPNDPGNISGASDPAEDAPPPQQPEMVQLEAAEWAEMQRMAAQREEYLGLAQRLKADFDNFRKRVKKDMEWERRKIRGDYLLAFFEILLHMERAMDSLDQAQPDQIREGFSLIIKQMKEFLEREGLQRISAKGEVFDPELHEAVSMNHLPEVAPNLVVEELSAGALLDGQLLRPAKVIVNQ